MKRFSNKIKMLRRAAAVLCMLAMLLVLAIPCYATEAATSAAEEEVRTIAAVVTDGDTAIAPVSDTNVSSADVSGTDVSASDAEGSSLQDTFKIMGQGMLGIFVVMLLIYLVIVILNVTTGKKKNDDVKL